MYLKFFLGSFCLLVFSKFVMMLDCTLLKFELLQLSSSFSCTSCMGLVFCAYSLPTLGPHLHTILKWPSFAYYHMFPICWTLSYWMVTSTIPTFSTMLYLIFSVFLAIAFFCTASCLVFVSHQFPLHL